MISALLVLVVGTVLYGLPFGDSDEGETAKEEQNSQTFTRIDLPAQAFAPEVAPSPSEVKEPESVPTSEPDALTTLAGKQSNLIEATSVPARRVIPPRQEEPKKLILEAKSRTVQTVRKPVVKYVAKKQPEVAPPREKPKRIIWNPTMRGRTPMFPLPTPEANQPKTVNRDVATTRVAVPRSVAAPAVEPRKRGSFITLGNFKPLQVSQSIPVPSPLQVGSREDRALGKVVAEVQRRESEEFFAVSDQYKNSPLPLTTEESLRAAGKIFVVQIGSFLNRNNAERLMLDLSEDGLEPYVHLFKNGAKRWYSVRMNYRSQDSAKRMADEISKSKSMPARVIELFYE